MHKSKKKKKGKLTPGAVILNYIFRIKFVVKFYQNSQNKFTSQIQSGKLHSIRPEIKLDEILQFCVWLHYTQTPGQHFKDKSINSSFRRPIFKKKKEKKNAKFCI